MTHSEHSLGSVIRQYRTERGFTQNQLSEQIDLSNRQIMSIEGGKCYPTFETLCRLVQTLNIPADHIFHPDTGDTDMALESFIALYRSCPPEEQELVLATAKALVDHLVHKRQTLTKV